MTLLVDFLALLSVFDVKIINPIMDIVCVFDISDVLSKR